MQGYTHRPTDLAELGHKRKVCRSCGVDWPCPDGVKERCGERMAQGQEWCDCGWHEGNQAADEIEGASP
jgi:hypothetical protein